MPTGPSGILFPLPCPIPGPPHPTPGIRASCLPLFLSHIYCRTEFTDELGSGRGQVLTEVAIFFGTAPKGAGKCWLTGGVRILQGPTSLELFVVHSSACLIVPRIYFPNCLNTRMLESGDRYARCPPLAVLSLNGGIPWP